MRLKNKIFHTFSYLKYLTVSKHARGQDIHSPFLYKLIREVFMNKYIPGRDREKISIFTKKIKESNRTLTPNTHGRRSQFYENGSIKPSKILRHSSISKKTGSLLYQLAKYYQPKGILELGTGIGLSTLYLRLACNAKITTVEGNPFIYSFTQDLFREMNLDAIECINQSFQDYLSNIQLDPLIEMVYLDGDHGYEPTLQIVNALLEKLPSLTILVIDDILWSPAMYKAFREISERTEFQLSLNLGQVGVFIRNQKLSKENWTIRR